MVTKVAAQRGVPDQLFDGCRSGWSSCTRSCSGQSSLVNRTRSIVGQVQCAAILIEQDSATCGSKECNSQVEGLIHSTALHVCCPCFDREFTAPGKINLQGVSCQKMQDSVGLQSALVAAIASSSGIYI